MPKETFGEDVRIPNICKKCLAFSVLTIDIIKTLDILEPLLPHLTVPVRLSLFLLEQEQFPYSSQPDSKFCHYCTSVYTNPHIRIKARPTSLEFVRCPLLTLLDVAGQEEFVLGSDGRGDDNNLVVYRWCKQTKQVQLASLS